MNSRWVKKFVTRRFDHCRISIYVVKFDWVSARECFGAFTRTFFCDTFARHTPARHAFGVACRNVGRKRAPSRRPEDRTRHYLETESSGCHFYVDSTCFFQEPAQSCIVYYLFHVYYRSAKQSARHDRDIRRFEKSIRIPRYTWLIEDIINAFTVGHTETSVFTKLHLVYLKVL